MWKMHARAFVLALLAIAMVGSATFALYKDVRAQKYWSDFVQSVVPIVTEGQDRVDEALEFCGVAAASGVEESLVAQLEDAAADSQLLIDSLSEIGEYIVPDDDGSFDGKTEDSPLAALDLYASVGDASRFTVETPEQPYEKVRYFREIRNELARALKEVNEATAAIESALEENLEGANEALLVSRDALRFAITRGWILDQYAAGHDALPEDRADLISAIEEGEELLRAQRDLDRNNPVKVAAAVLETNEAFEKIESAANTLAELLDVDIDEALQEMPVDEVWGGWDTWRPAPVPQLPGNANQGGSPTRPTTPGHGGGSSGDDGDDENDGDGDGDGNGSDGEGSEEGEDPSGETEGPGGETSVAD